MDGQHEGRGTSCATIDRSRVLRTQVAPVKHARPRLDLQTVLVMDAGTGPVSQAGGWMGESIRRRHTHARTVASLMEAVTEKASCACSARPSFESMRRYWLAARSRRTDLPVNVGRRAPLAVAWKPLPL